MEIPQSRKNKLSTAGRQFVRVVIVCAALLGAVLAVRADGMALSVLLPRITETDQVALIDLQRDGVTVDMYIAIDGIPAGKTVTYVLPELRADRRGAQLPGACAFACPGHLHPPLCAGGVVDYLAGQLLNRRRTSTVWKPMTIALRL